MTGITIGSGSQPYVWHDHWARVPTGLAGMGNARTHGVCVSAEGTLIVFAQCPDGILHFDVDGRLVAQHGGDDWRFAHGLTYVHDERGEHLWLTDERPDGRVAMTTLTGEVVREVAPIAVTHPDAVAGGYKPTWAAEEPDRRRVWVADGYGQSLVHRIGEDGTPDLTLTGEEGAGRFRCPHAIAIDTRGGKEPELYVADRDNGRIAVYSTQGRYLRKLEHAEMRRPSSFAFRGAFMLVADLHASLCIYDGDDEPVVAELGEHREACVWGEGWPNYHVTAEADRITPGRFNSPHAGCFGPNGSIYVVEWMLGGRITKLTPA
jgi:hypothetical protein